MGTSKGKPALEPKPPPLSATINEALARTAPEVIWIWFLPRFKAGRSTCAWRTPLLSAGLNCDEMSSNALMLAGSAPLVKLTLTVAGNDVWVVPSAGEVITICG